MALFQIYCGCELNSEDQCVRPPTGWVKCLGTHPLPRLSGTQPLSQMRPPSALRRLSNTVLRLASQEKRVEDGGRAKDALPPVDGWWTLLVVPLIRTANFQQQR